MYGSISGLLILLDWSVFMSILYQTVYHCFNISFVLWFWFLGFRVIYLFIVISFESGSVSCPHFFFFFLIFFKVVFTIWGLYNSTWIWLRIGFSKSALMEFFKISIGLWWDFIGTSLNLYVSWVYCSCNNVKFYSPVGMGCLSIYCSLISLSNVL